MKTIIIGLAAGACLTAGAVSAKPRGWVRLHAADEAPSVTVRYSELDLMREDGARSLIGRISQAARAVCGPEPASYAIGAFYLYRDCIKDSTAAAVRSVNAPLVSALYDGGRKAIVLAGR
jgi:UrcA family protein